MDIVVFLALWALVFTLPWEANYEVQGFLPGFETGMRLMGAVAFLLGIFTMLVTFSMRRLPRAFIPLGLFVAWSFVGMFWSLDPEVTQTMSVTFLLLLTLVWLIWQYADSVPRQEWLMRAFVCGMVIALLDMYYNIARGVDPLGGTKMLRYASTGANPNGMGMCLVIAINFAYYLVTRPGRKAGILLKFAYWGFMLAAAVAVFWTGSRSAAARSGHLAASHRDDGIPGRGGSRPWFSFSVWCRRLHHPPRRAGRSPHRACRRGRMPGRFKSGSTFGNSRSRHGSRIPSWASGREPPPPPGARKTSAITRSSPWSRKRPHRSGRLYGDLAAAAGRHTIDAENRQDLLDHHDRQQPPQRHVGKPRI